MKITLLPLFLLCLSCSLVGCGGAGTETDETGNEEAVQMEDDTNYEAEMMGGGEKK